MLDQTLDQLMFLDAILAKRERISSDHFNFRSLVLLGLGDHFHFPFCPVASLSSHAALRIQQSAEAPPKQVSTCLLGS